MLKPVVHKLKTGDRVKLKGRDAHGIIAKMDDRWATINWDDDLLMKGKARMVHLLELEASRITP